MLLETSGSNGTHDEEKLNHFLETSMNDGAIRDGTVTNNPTKINVKTNFFFFNRKKDNVQIKILFLGNLGTARTNRCCYFKGWILLQI